MEAVKNEYMDILQVLSVRTVVRDCDFSHNVLFLVVICLLEYHSMHMYLSILYHTILITKIHVLLSGI